MSKKKTKKRDHTILGIPILGPAIGCYVAYVICTVIGFTIGLPIDVITGRIELGELSASNTPLLAVYYAIVIGAILMIFIHTAWFRGEFKGCYSGNWGDKKTKLMLLIAIIATLFIIVKGFIENGVAMPTAEGLGVALSAGFCEEVCFRLVAISLALRKNADKKSIYTAIILSSVLFGVTHAANMFKGQSANGTLVQVIFALGLGFFFGAVYLRTGNLLITIIYHAVYDTLALMQAAGTDVQTMPESILLFIAAVFFIVCGIVLIVGNIPQITAVWNERWSREEAGAQ